MSFNWQLWGRQRKSERLWASRVSSKERKNGQKPRRSGTSRGVKSISLLLREIARDYFVNIMLICFFKAFRSKSNSVGNHHQASSQIQLREFTRHLSHSFKNFIWKVVSPISHVTEVVKEASRRQKYFPKKKKKKRIFVSSCFSEDSLKITKTTEEMKYHLSSQRHSEIGEIALWFIPTFWYWAGLWFFLSLLSVMSLILLYLHVTSQTGYQH